jgi:hypothetical protein
MMMASAATAPTTIPAIVPVDGPAGLCMLVGDTADVFVASKGGSDEDWGGIDVDAAGDLDEISDEGLPEDFVELVDTFSVERLVVVAIVGEGVVVEVVRDVELVVCDVVIITVVMVGIVLGGLVVVVGTMFDEVAVVVMGVLDGVAMVSSRIQNWPV